MTSAEKQTVAEMSLSTKGPHATLEDYDFTRLVVGKGRVRPKEKGIKIYATVREKEVSRERLKEKEKDKPVEGAKEDPK